MKQISSNYYNQRYLSSQSSVANDNILLYKKLFVPHSSNEMVVLDFGCGEGVLLSLMNCKYKIGVDINESVLDKTKNLGINEFHKNLNNIKSNSVDLIVSNSALEHVPNPHKILSDLYDILKINGKIIFRVPHETLGWNYKPGDWNYHLFTWSPMALGNLFNDVGFQQIEVKIEKSKRPPFFKILRMMYLEKLAGYIYRLLRMMLDELGIKPIGVDGYSIVSAMKK
ncbi:MAG: class I SAM-dependent methyltransferase [Flavobacteriaceae bacterium]|nr:class I SAM-dependent methyltransferase [Flavobacteriaceae bacterium]MBT6353345.1 class I SAM-dependent methyltransferase [Pelagibacteraceae bacterium]